MPEAHATELLGVAIAACGAITAVGQGVGALREALRNNSSGLRPCEQFNSPRFQSSIAGAASRNGVEFVDDPAFDLSHTALLEACAAAREVLSAIPSSRIGLVLSTTKANIEALERITDHLPCSDIARRHLQADQLAAD